MWKQVVVSLLALALLGCFPSDETKPKTMKENSSNDKDEKKTNSSPEKSSSEKSSNKDEVDDNERQSKLFRPSEW